MNAHEHERIERLKRRCEFLEKRIAAGPEGKRGHDQAELSAMRWAIAIVKLYLGTQEDMDGANGETA